MIYALDDTRSHFRAISIQRADERINMGILTGTFHAEELTNIVLSDPP
jgi:hypothetical protein